MESMEGENYRDSETDSGRERESEGETERKRDRERGTEGEWERERERLLHASGCLPCWIHHVHKMKSFQEECFISEVLNAADQNSSHTHTHTHMHTHTHTVLK